MAGDGWRWLSAITSTFGAFQISCHQSWSLPGTRRKSQKLAMGTHRARWAAQLGFPLHHWQEYWRGLGADPAQAGAVTAGFFSTTSSMATHTTSPSSHHGASLAASVCQQQPGKEGDGEASCPPWGHPCSPSTAMVSSLRPTWTAQGQRQPKIFMVKVMLEMASAVLVCSI